MLTANIDIKKATDRDFNKIWDIFHIVVATGDTYAYSPNTTKEEAYVFWMPPSKNTYIATINNNIVGTFIIKPNQPGLGSHIANAAYMVHPQYRGQGIGYTMGMYSIEEAKKLGYSAMQFNLVVSSNEPAVRLWEKIGFRIIGTVTKGFKHSSKGLIDAYIMHRFL